MLAALMYGYNDFDEKDSLLKNNILLLKEVNKGCNMECKRYVKQINHHYLYQGQTCN